MLLPAGLQVVEPVLRGNRGAVYSPSSFGIDFTTFGPDFVPGEHFDSDRYRELDFKHQYPRCTRHDGKIYDFQGRLTRSGSYWATQSLIGSAMSPSYVPLDQRRPSNPYRLARLIVRSFTNLVFGEGRFPAFTSDDPDTVLFCKAVAKQAEAAVRFVQARNIGGSVGTVGVSWRFWEGQARIRVHNGKHLIPHSWVDKEQYAVEHVTELQQTTRVEWDPKSKKRVRRYFWERRDWTPNADITFCEARADEPNEPIEWIVDEANTFEHGDGTPHFVWIRNGADDDDGTGIDGQCDFEGQCESLDGLDTLSSVLSSGTTKNLDPTLILKMEQQDAARARAGGVEKGSNAGILVGTQGDAKYLELAGTATTAGISLFEKNRGNILETSQCVVPSTAELTTAGTSALAQKMLFAPMLSGTNVHRTQYGGGLVRLFEQMLASARRRYPQKDPETGELIYAVQVSDDGGDEGAEPTEEEVDFYLDLPPEIVSENVVDEHGQPTGETKETSHEIVPGVGKISLTWPAYFESTATDVQAKSVAVTTATGQKPVLSQQTGSEIMAGELNVDPKREWERLTAEQRASADVEAGMFANGAGGKVGDRDELPPGAKPMATAAKAAEPGKAPPSAGAEPPGGGDDES